MCVFLNVWQRTSIQWLHGHCVVYAFVVHVCMCACVHVCQSRGGGGVKGSCVSLCLVLTHPAINCVSTAAVCSSQIESNATGPFCFPPLGWASRPPHSHSSQPTFQKNLHTTLYLCRPLTLASSPDVHFIVYHSLSLALSLSLSLFLPLLSLSLSPW